MKVSFLIAFISYSSTLMALGILIFGLISNYEDFRRVNLFVALLFLITASIIKEFYYFYNWHGVSGVVWFELTCKIFISFAISSVSHVSREIIWAHKLKTYGTFYLLGLLLLHFCMLIVGNPLLLHSYINIQVLLSMVYTFFIVIKFGVKEEKLQKAERTFCKVILSMLPVLIFIGINYDNIPFLGQLIDKDLFLSGFIFIPTSFFFIYTSLIKHHQVLMYKSNTYSIASIKSILTNKEFEVCTLLIQGKSNKELADTLFIAVSTVKTHIRNIYTKLDISSRYELISMVSQKMK